MELKINSVTIPEQITFNYDELKKELTEKVKIYESMVYTDDQIKMAKSDRASLNALKKALNDERIRREKEYMLPFNQFKAQINEIISIIDKPCAVIDQQIKSFEDQQKAEKQNQINELWIEHGADDWMVKNDPKWLNASVSLKTIEGSIKEHLLQIQKDLDTLDGLGIGFEAMQKYQSTLDLNMAIAEEAKIKAQAEAKAKWEAEHSQMTIEEKTEDPVGQDINVTSKTEESREWIKFQAFVTVDEAKDLGKYLRSHGINFKAI